MIIDENTPNLDGYKIHAENGEQIFGCSSFNTETQEAEMMYLEQAQVLSEVQTDGSKKHYVRGNGVSVKKFKIEGAYATFRGLRVE